MIKRPYLSFTLLLLLSMCILGGCEKEKSHTVLELFSESQSLSPKKDFYVNEDSIAIIEGLSCDGKNLIVNDYHSGCCYTLFDKKSGEYIAGFGTIGQGPAELPSPCYGYLTESGFTVFDDQTRIVMKYSLDSLRNSRKKDGSPVRLAQYKIPEAQISKLIAIDDTTLLCAGTYKSRYQYLLFNKNDSVLDYGVDVYNAADSAFQTYTRYLSNQGNLVMNPEKHTFAGSINFSSNIDFFEIVNNKIELIKSLRLGDPINKPVNEEGIYYVDLTENTQTGYIDLSATSKYVYALYSDKKMYENNRKSDTVLVFDWDGNPIKKYSLDTDAYYIAVDSTQQSLFAAVKNSSSGWKIICYALD